MDTDVLVGFAVGAGVGATVALLLASESGQQVRQRIQTKADEGTQYLTECASSVRGSAADLVDKGKEALGRAQENIAEAAGAGRQAYNDVVNS
jgi:gas vesicle protein